MLNPDLIFQARWQDLYVFLADGDPPLILRLLIINTIFLIFFVIRRARGKPRLKSSSAHTVQVFLIVANFSVIFSNHMLSLAQLKDMLT